MDTIRLVKPCIENKVSYLEMLEEWKASGEKLIPWVLGFDTSDFEGMLQKLEDYSQGIGLQDGQVPHTTLWLINEAIKL